MRQSDARILVFDRDLIEQRKYWTERLSEDFPTARLPLNGHTDYVRTGERETVPLPITKSIVKEIAKLTGNSPFLTHATLMTALKVCLYRYTQYSRIAVGCPARRTNTEADDPVNTLVIVNEIDGRMTFRPSLSAIGD